MYYFSMIDNVYEIQTFIIFNQYYLIWIVLILCIENLYQRFVSETISHLFLEIVKFVIYLTIIIWGKTEFILFVYN